MVIKRATWIVAVLGCGLLACDWPQTYRVPSRPGEPFTEEIAVQASRTALIASGYDSALLEPVCHRQPCKESEKYLARTAPGSNSGYILWRVKDGSPGLYQLSVTVTKAGDQLECEILRAK